MKSSGNRACLESQGESTGNRRILKPFSAHPRLTQCNQSLMLMEGHIEMAFHRRGRRDG